MSAEKVAFIIKCRELDVAALEGLLDQLELRDCSVNWIG
jgi:hypothetical protein